MAPLEQLSWMFCLCLTVVCIQPSEAVLAFTAANVDLDKKAGNSALSMVCAAKDA